MITPGSTIGILGGGQLGRMMILAGRAMGYKFHVYEPHGPCPAGHVADKEINAEYSDKEALHAFAQEVDLITLEFENIPADIIEDLGKMKPIFPGKEALHICQHRQREKDFLKANNLPCTPFEYADSPESLGEAIEKVSYPCVIKTASFGYDGKGQIKLEDPAEDLDALWEKLGTPQKVVVEKWVHHIGEFSVICARKENSEKVTFPMSENIHVDHILHLSISPARITEATRKAGEELAKSIADRLNLVGLLAVEFFLDEDGELLINEMAPRPHNSGHHTIEGAFTSQFEQHIRAVTGLPFGSSDQQSPAVMVNLLGDLWLDSEPDWTTLLNDPLCKLHLYDKSEARPKRKMGHFTVIGDDIDEVLDRAEKHFKEISRT